MPHQMNDRDILSAILMEQKHLAEEYNHTASHTDDPQLLQTLTQILAEKQRTRLSVYQAMHERGWYNPQLIDQSQLDQAKQKMQQTQQKLQSILSGSGFPQNANNQQYQNISPHGYQNQGFQNQGFQNQGFAGQSQYQPS